MTTYADKFIPKNLGDKMKRKSETAKCRERLKQYCIGSGLDIGYGGDPIVPEAITIDLHNPYGAPAWNEDRAPQNLKGDCRDLYWFRNSVFDYVFSSHLLEDFREEQMIIILEEWTRVVKIGGYIILYCPDQQRYLAHCEKNKTSPNANHKIENFSYTFFAENILPYFYRNLKLKPIHYNYLVDDYSWEVVMRKET